MAIIGGGPSAHAAAVYLGRAELQPIMFEGWWALFARPIAVLDSQIAACRELCCMLA